MSFGLSIDVGPTMTAKIPTPLEKGVHCSTYRPLMSEKLADPFKQDCMKAFLQMAEEWWGTRLVRGQLEEVGLIAKPYLDNQQTSKTFPTLKEEVTLEAED